MSYELLGEDVEFFQRMLKIDRLYDGKIDGIWGRKTEDAAIQFEHASKNIKKEYGDLDMRSENNIQTLTLRAQSEARLFMQKLLENDINAKIISGTRTYEEQNKLYRQGRFGNEGNIVTKAKGGRSNHNFGIAWDIGIFKSDGKYSRNENDYNMASKIGLSESLQWGGHWTTFQDPPHYQLKIKYSSIKLVRESFESGMSFYV